MDKQVSTTKKQILYTILNTSTFYSLLLLLISDTVRELLSHIPATVKSDPPSGVSVLGVLGNESGMTPLHFAAYSGNENVVRLLLNSAGVQVDASTLESVIFYFYYLTNNIETDDLFISNIFRDITHFTWHVSVAMSQSLDFFYQEQQICYIVLI